MGLSCGILCICIHSQCLFNKAHKDGPLYESWAAIINLSSTGSCLYPPIFPFHSQFFHFLKKKSNIIWGVEHFPPLNPFSFFHSLSFFYFSFLIIAMINFGYDAMDVSQGSPTIGSVLLEPGSLLTFQDEAFENAYHGILDSKCDRIDSRMSSKNA